MSKVQQRAGGGKVTVEGLIPEAIKSGETVTVKQGSKIVERAAGTLTLKRTFVTDVAANKAAYTIDVKNILPNYKELTTENFVATNMAIYGSSGAATGTGGSSNPITLSYNSATGILSIPKTSYAYGVLTSWGYKIYCYYV